MKNISLFSVIYLVTGALGMLYYGVIYYEAYTHGDGHTLGWDTAAAFNDRVSHTYDDVQIPSLGLPDDYHTNYLLNPTQFCAMKSITNPKENENEIRVIFPEKHDVVATCGDLPIGAVSWIVVWNLSDKLLTVNPSKGLGISVEPPQVFSDTKSIPVKGGGTAVIYIKSL